MAERSDSVSLMFHQENGNYAGGNEILNFQGDTVEMVWGFGETPVTCTIS
jgi:hypothetical protein